jgi:hypothetical protein
LIGEAWRRDLYSVEQGDGVCYVEFPERPTTGERLRTDTINSFSHGGLGLPHLDLDVSRISGRALGLEIGWPDEFTAPMPDFADFLRKNRRNRKE